ncbi:MAG: hypothetical protein ACOY3Z_12230 [Thermodesulfobacteriota bacterium]
MRDNLLPGDVVQRLFCPSCQERSTYDASTMVEDNGWRIEYDMMLAKMAAATKLRMEMDEVDPEFLFDQGYACWLEMYPGEREEIREEKERITALLQEDQRRYLETIQAWNINRVARLKDAGWRKARMA